MVKSKKHIVTASTEHSDESNVRISPCRCKHEWQDKRYGTGNRVFNRNLRDKNKNEGVCTVCGTRKTF